MSDCVQGVSGFPAGAGWPVQTNVQRRERKIDKEIDICIDI